MQWSDIDDQGLYRSPGDGTVDPSAPLGTLAAWGSGPTNVYFVGPFGIAQGDGSTWGTPYQPNTLSAVGICGTSASNIYVVGGNANGVCVYHWF